MKFLFLIFFSFVINSQEEFRKVSLFDNKLVFCVPKRLKEYKPSAYWGNDYKYRRRFFASDSSIMMEVKVRYKQEVGLHLYLKAESDEFLGDLDGIDKHIIKQDVLHINNRTVLLIICEFSSPGYKKQKYIAQRMVFNTSAGVTKINALYGYNENEGNLAGEEFLGEIFRSVEMR